MKNIKLLLTSALCILALTACNSDNGDSINTEASKQTTDMSVTAKQLDEASASCETYMTSAEMSETVTETKSEIISEAYTSAFETETEAENEPTAAAVTDITAEKSLIMTDGIKLLTGAMIVELSNSAADNGVVSGYSAYSAMMSIYPYTAGETREEIEAVLGCFDLEKFNSQRDSMPIETGSLFLIDEETVLNTWDDKGFVYRDLQDSSIVDIVNSFVSEKTHELIPTFINTPFDNGTRAVVLDALYLKADWKNKFSSGSSCEDVFYGKNGEENVTYMFQENYFAVYGNMIQLEYSGSGLVMDIVRDIDSAVGSYEKYISEYSQLDNADKRKVNLIMPKFESEFDESITNCYRQLGIEQLFGNSSDLSLLADGISVSDVRQKTVIKVDENGTEAAAFTAMMVGATAEPKPEEIVDFHIQEPFLYVIRDIKTDTILFAGYYYDF